MSTIDHLSSPEDVERYANEDLVLDHERVLTYSHLRCPLRCKYCFVDDMQHAQSGAARYLSPSQMDLLLQLPERIQLIMLGCDTEFFLHRQEAFDILEQLARGGRDISVITKLILHDAQINRLVDVDRMYRTRGKTLTFSVSLPCWDSAHEWEPRAPSPRARAALLKKVHDAGIQTLVAIRPLLPTISVSELEDIVRATVRDCAGYYSGPLYAKTPASLLPDAETYNLPVERRQPHWMPEGNAFTIVEKQGQMDDLRSIVARAGARLFDGAADAISSLRAP